MEKYYVFLDSKNGFSVVLRDKNGFGVEHSCGRTIEEAIKKIINKL